MRRGNGFLFPQLRQLGAGAALDEQRNKIPYPTLLESRVRVLHEKDGLVGSQARREGTLLLGVGEPVREVGANRPGALDQRLRTGRGGDAVPNPSRNGRQIPPDTDPQGFVGYPGARCNHTNPAVAIGRTSQSLVVICQTGVGRFYYKGFGLQNGSSVEIDDPVLMGAASTFVATNNGVQYSFSPTALTITQGSAVVSNEPMLE